MQFKRNLHFKLVDLPCWQVVDVGDGKSVNFTVSKVQLLDRLECEFVISLVHRNEHHTSPYQHRYKYLQPEQTCEYTLWRGFGHSSKDRISGISDTNYHPEGPTELHQVHFQGIRNYMAAHGFKSKVVLKWILIDIPIIGATWWWVE